MIESRRWDEFSLLQVYLARTEGSAEGRISWKFDFSPAGLKIKSVSIAAASQTFQSGRVCWRLQAGSSSTEFSGGTATSTLRVTVTAPDSFPVLDPSDGSTHSFQNVAGSSELTVTAELGGGDGDVSWQHSQLFRQSLKQTEDYSFDVQICLDD